MPLTKSYYKWRRYYKKRYGRKKKSLYKKSRRLRKYQKGGRNTNTLIFKRETTTEIKIGNAVGIQFLNMYDVLFGIEDFLMSKDQWDQFKLDWISISIKYQSAKAVVNEAPFYVYSLFDRTGLPNNGNEITLKDLISYGTYKKTCSYTSGYASTSQFIVPTTIQEKGQWLSTDIMGVAARNNTSFSGQIIPRYRNIYFPWNPTVICGAFLQNLRDENQYDGTINLRVQIAVTFRGKRQLLSYDDKNEVKLMAGGETEDTMINPPSGKIEIEEQQKMTDGIPYNTFDKLTTTATNYITKQLIGKNIKTELPNFNTVVSYVGNIATDIGKEVYNSWMHKIIAFCAGTFVSALQNLASYGLRNVVSANPSSNDNNFIGLNGGTSYYFTDSMATDGIDASLSDSATAVISDFIHPFNAGNHLRNWWINAAKQYFIGDNAFNDVGSCSLYYKVESNSIGFIKSLVSQSTIATNMCQWQSVNCNVSGTTNVPATGGIIIQFPHANYWITGIIYNNEYVGSGNQVTTYPINFYNIKDTICLDGEKFINTDVSHIIHICTFTSVTGFGFSFNAVNSTTSSATPIQENVIDCITLPVRTMRGNGMIGPDGPYTSIESMGLIYPLYFSKNRLFI